MRTTAIHNLIIRRLRFSLSLSLCSHSSITFSRLCNHTHSHNHNMFSLRTTRACALFFVQIFPSLFSAIAVFWSFKERRERERVEEEKKSVCKLLKSFMNERIGAKKGKTRCSHIHSRHFPFFFSLLFLFVAPVYFCHCFCLSW